MLGAGLQQHSLMVAQHRQRNREPSVSCARCAACLLCPASGPGPWPSPVGRDRDTLPGLGQHLLEPRPPLLQGLYLTVLGGSITRRSAWTQGTQLLQPPLRQLAMFYMNGGQERYKFFQFPAWGPQRGLRCRRSRDASCLLISILSQGSGYILMRSCV